MTQLPQMRQGLDLPYVSWAWNMGLGYGRVCVLCVNRPSPLSCYLPNMRERNAPRRYTPLRGDVHAHGHATFGTTRPYERILSFPGHYVPV